MDVSERRKDLGDFLRTRRERLKPDEVGMPFRNRRRTPGLRREEVAELASIGVSWYTLLEQGQDVNPSRQVLEALARALRLSAAEEEHLFLLANQELPARSKIEDESAPVVLRQIIDALNPHPAFVISRRWDVLTWNRAANFLSHFDEPVPPHPNNVVWRYFMGEARKVDSDWERQAQNLVAQLRADATRYPGEASFSELIGDLRRESREFRIWWERHDVRELPAGRREMQHPKLGPLVFEQVTLEAGNLRIKVYLGSDETIAKFQFA